MDDLLWPDEHPGFRDDDGMVIIDPRELSRWRSFRQRRLNAGDPVGWGEWQDMEKRMAWPARLAEISGMSVVNEAAIGSSMEWVARQTVDGVSRLLRDHPPDRIMAIVSPATWPRLQHYIAAEGRWGSMQLADPNGMDRHVHGWFLSNEDDHSLVTRWLVSLSGMAAMLDSLGVRLVLLDPGMPDMDHVLDQHPGLGHLRDSMDAVCRESWHPRTMLDIGKAVELPRCPDLHWRREVHQLVAEDLSRYLC